MDHNFLQRDSPGFRSAMVSKHTTSSPYYPQSNGLAQSAVKIAENILRQEDPCLALMVYRSTTVGSIGYSPSEVMLNRPSRTTLPTLPKNIEPRVYDEDKVKKKQEASQRSNEFYYNRRHSSRPLPVLKKGDQVWIKTGKDDEWSRPAVMIGTTNTPRSYIVQTETDVVRRNRRHLLRVPRDERERCNEENEEVPQNTPEPMVLNNQSADCESPVESTYSD